MTQKGDIMTIKIDIDFQQIKEFNLFNINNDVLLLNKQDFLNLDTVSGCVWEMQKKYYLEYQSILEKSNLLLEYICNIEIIRSSYNRYVFFGTDWQESNRIVQYYGLKKICKNLDNVIVRKIEKNNLLQFQAIKNVNKSSIDEIANFFNVDNSCCLIFLPISFCQEKNCLNNFLYDISAIIRPRFPVDFSSLQLEKLLLKIMPADGIIISRFILETFGFYGLSNPKIIKFL